MQNVDAYSLEDLKTIYRILHAGLPEHPELMDSELLHDLQVHLQRKATEAGVDVSLHAQWAAWLGEPAARGV